MKVINDPRAIGIIFLKEQNEEEFALMVLRFIIEQMAESGDDPTEVIRIFERIKQTIPNGTIH